MFDCIRLSLERNRFVSTATRPQSRRARAPPSGPTGDGSSAQGYRAAGDPPETAVAGPVAMIDDETYAAIQQLQCGYADIATRMAWDEATSILAPEVHITFNTASGAVYEIEGL